MWFYTVVTNVVDTTSVAAAENGGSMPDFGVFAKLADYGPLGLAVLALGYVAWIFIKRNMDEKDRLRKEAENKNTKRKRTKK